MSVFGAPAVDGLGNAGGFKLMVEATGDVNFNALQGQADKLAAQGSRQPGLVGLFNGFRAGTPQLYVDVDRTKVQDDGRGPHRRLRHPPGLPGRLLRQRLQPLRPYLAGERPGRRSLSRGRGDVKQLKVRNADGDMVPLGAVVDVRDSAGPLTVTRYNMFPSATITGASLPGRQHRRRPPDDGRTWRTGSCRAP